MMTSDSPVPLRRPELLSPAGDRDCIHAAVENGADAVYFGLECGFNARARATNLHLDDLPEVMTGLHRRGVLGYVTLNTLIFSGELASAEATVKQLAVAGVDAVLVQDLGLARLIRQICPELTLHASTQMTLSSAECIAAVEALGIERVVLPRELSVAEIAQIRQQTSMSLEAFVHGALCVAYSGQCLTSESLGGRSANRGQCAQACRLPYDLVCDERDVDLGEMKYLLSPQDLAAYELTPDLIAAGVDCFKIEGRLKTPEYVANITRRYREAIDAAAAGLPVSIDRAAVMEMELSFSRGFSPGWLGGNDHKMLVPGMSSAKRGVRIGRVERVDRNRVLMQLEGPLAPGDGVVFDGDREKGQEQGGRIYELHRDGRRCQTADAGELIELTFGHDSIDLHALYPGQYLWKTDDPKLTARLRKTFAGPDPIRKLPLDLQVTAIAGQPFQASGQAGNGAVCEIASEEPLEVARRHPLSEELLREQFSRLGGTPYELRNLSALIEGEPMVPLSVLGRLRKSLVEQLEAWRPPVRQVAAGSPLADLRQSLVSPGKESASSPDPVLRVLCRRLDQLEPVISAGVTQVLADFQDIREYRQAVEIAHGLGATIYLATPRIQKPDEFNLFKALEKHGADGVLVRNLAGLRYYVERGLPTAADFSLNAANELTAHWLHEAGAERVTASYDLNREQLLDLAAAAAVDWLEVVVHQHMPMFHMEHCVFCAVLSPGTNKHNCGRPCDVHQVQLRDRTGVEHPLLADVGCRNTLFNATPQSAAEIVPALLASGVKHFRVELLQQSPFELQPIVTLYQQLLAGEVTGREVWRKLQAANRVGVTRGALEERRDPLAII
ncbi:DUF3656 domain-containing U32 family peptidase [Lignipirellula cremea]|uniref:Putative protease YhbU n=1 Tax=Lignipirellula cremea TaxID=2528010 RepID=A0A518DMK7_9BACT|nr:U32 family peptidase [Lignipirellula cremea]QDU93069.1 putative protease YhbU precursor [Lignipirellula cremea]